MSGNVKSVEHTAERENDVQELCAAVLGIDPHYVGDHKATCPFCYASEHIGLPPSNYICKY